MIINFNDSTYEKLIFLATKEGCSLAAYISNLMDAHTGQLVNVTYTMNDVPAGSEIIPRPVFKEIES